MPAGADSGWKGGLRPDVHVLGQQGAPRHAPQARTLELSDKAYAAYELFKWADSPERALVCTVRDVLRLRPAYPGIDFSTSLYLHGRWPCVYVELVGLVVGISPLERACRYTLDDGTGTIEVYCAGRPPPRAPPAPPAGTEQGVYSCYVPPAPAPAPAAAPAREELFRVGELVRCVGRVRAFARDSETLVYATTCDPVADATEEPQHALRALHMAHDVYAHPPTLPPHLAHIPLPEPPANTKAGPGPPPEVKAPPSTSAAPPPSAPILPASSPRAPGRHPPAAKERAVGTGRSAGGDAAGAAVGPPSARALRQTLLACCRRLWRQARRHTSPVSAVITAEALYADAELDAHARSIVRAKLAARGAQRGNEAHGVRRLVAGTVDGLVQEGVLLRVHGGDAVQLASARLIASCLGALLGVSRAPRGERRLGRAFTAFTIRQRLQRADVRFAHVSQHAVDAALAEMEVYELVARDGSVWRTVREAGHPGDRSPA